MVHLICLLALLSPLSSMFDTFACNGQAGSFVEQYRFPEFREGQVYFVNGTVTKAKLNYNFQYGQIQFIGGKGDTLLLTRKEKIRQVAIDGAVFCVSEEFGDLEMVSQAGGVILARKTSWVITGDKNNHSGQKFTAAGSQSASSFISNQGGAFQWLNNTSAPGYKLRSGFYLIDWNRRCHEASRSGFLKIYAKERKALRRYLSETKVDFKKETDLRTFLDFCSRLI